MHRVRANRAVNERCLFERIFQQDLVSGLLNRCDPGRGIGTRRLIARMNPAEMLKPLTPSVFKIGLVYDRSDARHDKSPL